jgi:hypothetical protein
MTTPSDLRDRLVPALMILALAGGCASRTGARPVAPSTNAAVRAGLLPPPSTESWAALGPVRHVGRGETPGVCIDPAGVVHVVSMADGQIHHRRFRAQGFVSPTANPKELFLGEQLIPAPEGPNRYNSPHLVCSPRGGVYVTFVRDTGTKSKKAWYTFMGKAGTWAPPTLVLNYPDEGGRVSYPRLALAHKTEVLIGAHLGDKSALIKVVTENKVPRVDKTVIETTAGGTPLVGFDDRFLLVGRSKGTQNLFAYDAALEKTGEAVRLSEGVPVKTSDPVDALIDDAGVVHTAGILSNWKNRHVPQPLWYTNTRRVQQKKPPLVGVAVGCAVESVVYPTMAKDERGFVYISYRDFTTGEGRIALVDETNERILGPYTVAPEVTQLSHWNPQVTPAQGGGVYVAWHAGGEVFVRGIGVQDLATVKRSPSIEF